MLLFLGKQLVSTSNDNMIITQPHVRTTHDKNSIGPLFASAAPKGAKAHANSQCTSLDQFVFDASLCRSNVHCGAK